MHRNPRVVLLSGGVGGARLARGLAAIVPAGDLTVIVNVGDDAILYGVRLSADLDTVVYTLAGIEGPEGWGIARDTFAVMGHLADLGTDTRFRLGDRDLATCLARTAALAAGHTLSAATVEITRALGVDAAVIPATDDPVATTVRTDRGWLGFQDYFVLRGHRDEVDDLDYGAGDARPAPGVLEAIADADVIVIGPSNPPLSIWPMMAIPGIREAVAGTAAPVVAVSPLFGGKPVKGPADRVMRSLGLPAGNAGVAAAYEGLLSHLTIDTSDAADAPRLATAGLQVIVADTRIADAVAAQRFATSLLTAVLP